MSPGKFITIEGTEGAGKSTVLQVIRDYLIEHHFPVLVTREPGGTPFAEEIRQLLLFPVSNETILAETELLLMFAGRLQHLNHCVKPALESGSWVISDRYIDASYAYQGGGRAIEKRMIEILDQCFIQEYYPHLTFLLDIPVDLGLLRIEKRNNGKDRIEKEKLDFFQRVRLAYLERAKAYPERIKIIDASQSILSVQEQIYRELNRFLKHSEK